MKMANMNELSKRMKKILPNHTDTPEKKSWKQSVLLVLAMIAAMIVFGVIAFWISVRGKEEVLVPKVEQEELITALSELQEKELYPRIQVRYSSDFEKGLVIEQKPTPGSIVKAGRRITLVVSKGPIIDKVADYVGQDLEDVRLNLKTLFASYRALIKIKEPVIYQFDPSPRGTILAQKPEAGTVIGSVTDLELVVSRGPRGELIEVGDYVGLDFQDALAELAALNIPFVFNVRTASGEEESGVILAQTPEAGSEVPYGSVLQMSMSRPRRLEDGKVFGVFEYVLPDYPIMVDISLDSITPGEKTTLVAMKHPGGPISIPYVVEENSELVLYIFDSEEIRQHAGVGGS
jgi:beta-lactam-binding protein with PASTA domain